jgi:hypothetical protein
MGDPVMTVIPYGWGDDGDGGDGSGTGGDGDGDGSGSGGSGSGGGGSNDPNNPGTTFTVTALASSTQYNQAPGVFQITRSGGDPTQSATATPEIEGTAPGSDYTLGTAFTFLPGVTTITVNVTATEASKLEDESSGTVELAIDNGDDGSGDNTSQATVTINIPPKPQISIAADEDEISEQWGSTVLTVSRDTDDLSDSLTLPYEVTGDAVNGQDYFYLFGDVTFLAGQATAPIVVAAVDQGLDSGSETMTVSLDPSDGYVLADNSSATVTIVNDDPVFASNGGPLDAPTLDARSQIAADYALAA